MADSANIARRRAVGGTEAARSSPPAPAAEPPKSRQPPLSRTESYLSMRWVIPMLSVLAVGFYLLSGYWTEKPIDPKNYQARAETLMKRTPLIDGHNDLPYLLRTELKNKIYENFDFSEGLASQTDLKRLREGRVGGQFWSVYIECPNTTNLDDPTHSVRDTLEQIDVAHRLFKEYPSLHFCSSSSCAVKAFKKGKVPSMLGAEGLHQASSSIATIRQFHKLGVRYITLTHNCDNPFATAASTVTATGKDGGLTEFGREGVREMNRLGVMVDLAHVSHGTMRDVLDITESPVIFSHTGCYTLAPNYRNAPDDVFARLKDNGGVAMIYFVGFFLNVEEPEKADIETAVDHIFHVAKVAGWDHVGIGGDFDGTVTLVNGINNVSDYPKLIERVLARGATDAQVRKLLGGNILRVWAENEKVAKRLQRSQNPVEEVWEARKWTKWDGGELPVMFPDRG